jgi:hypothetical protein
MYLNTLKSAYINGELYVYVYALGVVEPIM